MRFEPNAGQWNPGVKFAARASDYNVALTPREAVINGALAIRLLRSNPSPIIEGADALPSTSHYFLGNRRENWRTGRNKVGDVFFQSWIHDVVADSLRHDLPRAVRIVRVGGLLFILRSARSTV